MTVAVKYCGGCNPRYNRVALVRQLEEEFPEIVLVHADAPEPDLVAIICGCLGQCVNHQDLVGRHGKVLVSGMEGYDALRQAIIDCKKQQGAEKWTGETFIGSA